MQIILVIFVLLWTQALAYGAESQSVYFLGLASHADPNPKTHEGNMWLLGYSREYQVNSWQLEPGVNSYIDSYDIRSYTVFMDISHDDFKYTYFRPMLSLSCMYKGISHDNDEMAFRCYPLLKIRIGGETNLFANIIPIPYVSGVTNGLIAVEVGYRW